MAVSAGAQAAPLTPGVFNGTIVSAVDQKPFAAVSLQVESGDPSGFEGVLLVRTAQSETRMEFTGASFNLLTGAIKITWPVTLHDGSVTTIELTGTLSGGGTIDGTLSNPAYPEQARALHLTNGAALPATDSLTSTEVAVFPATGAPAVYKSTIVVPFVEAPEAITLSISDFGSSEDELVNLLSAQELVDVELTIGGDDGLATTVNTVLFQNAVLDKSARTLVAHGDGVTTLSDLTCSATGTEPLGASTWSCALNTPGNATTLVFTPAAN
jgi:hypothetical protein